MIDTSSNGRRGATGRGGRAALAGIVAAALVACAPLPKPKKDALAPDELRQMRYEMADHLVAQRDFDRALPYIRALAARHPKDLRLKLLLGIVLREKGMLAVAKKELQALVRKAPASPAARAAYAVLLDKMGKHKEAERHHREALRLAPDDARHHNDLGFCLFVQKRFKEAQECLERAIQIDPGMRRAYNNLGFVHGLQGNESRALEAFQQAGGKAMALTNMGLVAELRGYPQRARRYYERALRSSASFRPAERNLRALQPQVDRSQSGGSARTSDEVQDDGEPAVQRTPRSPQRAQPGDDGQGEGRSSDEQQGDHRGPPAEKK